MDEWMVARYKPSTTPLPGHCTHATQRVSKRTNQPATTATSSSSSSSSPSYPRTPSVPSLSVAPSAAAVELVHDQMTTAAVGAGGSTRWCPTPEQLMILEEMYRGGLRTPNASQIQQITAHLAHYGRIEGKNVFYWFQNHKARDRQKLRRRLCMSHHLLSCAHYYATAAGHHHHHHLLGAAAVVPPPLQAAQQYYSHSGGGAGGFLDLHQQQQHHLLPATPTSATTPAAAAYAAAAASYCYPFAGAPTSRCAATPSPPNPLFHYQGAGGLPEHSLRRLGNLGVMESSDTTTTTTSGYELASMEAAGDQPAMTAPPPLSTTTMGFCRPLKTLDLFPGALKEEHRDVV